MVRPGCGTVLREGTDGVIFAYGPMMLHQALQAAELLSEDDIAMRVVNMPWLNRVDTAWLDEQLRGIRCAVVVEDHAPYGGLFDCLTKNRILSGLPLPPVFRQLAVEGTPACGAIEEVLRHHGLDAISIRDIVKKSLAGPC
jgi:transketolase